MPSNELNVILAELSDVESKLKARIEKIYGKIEATDFSGEYLELVDCHARLQALVSSWEKPGVAS